MANILVIDDDTSLLQMMSIMLKRAGHTTVLADNGKEGIEAARRAIPDMVIIDVMMPEMSGYEVCKALRKDATTQKIPLLMLTALSQGEHRGRAEDAGADGFVTKPVTRDDLIKHVEELLRTGARNFPDFTDQLPAVPDEGAPAPATPAPGPAQATPPAAKPAPTPEPITNIMMAPTPVAPPPPTRTPPAPAPAQPVGTSSGIYPAVLTRLPLVAVVGLGSGAGTTTISVNMVTALMQFGRACIIDLNYRGGQVAAQLRVAPRGTWLDLRQFKPGSDKRMIGQALSVGQVSHIALIAAPPTPVAERLTGTALFNTFSVLTEGFSRIVVDLPTDLDATTIATLNTADQIVLVVGNDPTSLMNVPNTLATIEAMRLPGQIRVVLNHSRPQGISYEQVLQSINQPLAADIPYEPAQMQALTSGQPLVMSAPDTLFARTVLHLARQM